MSSQHTGVWLPANTILTPAGVKYLQDLAKHNPRDYATAILEEDKLRGPPEELIEPSFLARTDREMHQ